MCFYAWMLGKPSCHHDSISAHRLVILPCHIFAWKQAHLIIGNLRTTKRTTATAADLPKAPSQVVLAFC